MNPWELAERLRLRELLTWGYRMEICGAERIPRDGAGIIVANHEAISDPWLVAVATRRPLHFVAKAELWRIPLVGRLVDAFGCVPVERGRGDLDALAQAGRLLDDGELVVMFPRGTCKPGSPRRWHRGAARLALAHGAPLLPVRLENTRQLLPRRAVRIVVGEPIMVEQGKPTIGAARTLTLAAERAVEALA
jgi:1-acyl-sn-glycerol-3-phosphate acyltransferase